MRIDPNDLEGSELISDLRGLHNKRYNLDWSGLVPNPLVDPYRKQVELRVLEFLKPDYDWNYFTGAETALDIDVLTLVHALGLADERKKSPARILHQIGNLSALARISHMREFLYGHCSEDLVRQAQYQPRDAQAVTRIFPQLQRRRACNELIRDETGNIYATFQARLIEDLEKLSSYFANSIPESGNLRRPLYDLLYPYDKT